LRPDPAQCRVIRTRFFTGLRVYNAVVGEFIARSSAVKADPAWLAARELPRRTKEERAVRRAESAGGDRRYEFSPNTTALSQTCLCGNREKKPLSQRVHRCGCGTTEDRDLFSAYPGLYVRAQVDGCDRLDLQAANHGWLHRHDVDGSPRSGRTPSNRRGRRHPPSRRSVARINARRKAKAAMRPSRSARTPTTDQPTALLAA
jgi:hypothetical protein